MGAVGAVGAVGGEANHPCSKAVWQLYCTELYKERKEIEVVYNYNYRLYSKSIHPEFPTPLSQKKDRT